MFRDLFSRRCNLGDSFFSSLWMVHCFLSFVQLFSREVNPDFSSDITFSKFGCNVFISGITLSIFPQKFHIIFWALDMAPTCVVPGLFINVSWDTGRSWDLLLFEKILKFRPILLFLKNDEDWLFQLVTGTKAVVEDLEVDEEMEFRVAAVVESMGVGEYGSTETPTRVRYPPCMPHLLTYPKKTITVKAGEELRIPVTFKASPTPTITWTNRGQPAKWPLGSFLTNVTRRERLKSALYLRAQKAPKHFFGKNFGLKKKSKTRRLKMVTRQKRPNPRICSLFSATNFKYLTPIK